MKGITMYIIINAKLKCGQCVTINCNAYETEELKTLIDTYEGTVADFEEALVAANIDASMVEVVSMVADMEEGE